MWTRGYTHAHSELPHLYKPREKTWEDVKQFRGVIVLDEELSSSFGGLKEWCMALLTVGSFTTDGEYSEPNKKKRKKVLCKILGCKKKKIKYNVYWKYAQHEVSFAVQSPLSLL